MPAQPSRLPAILLAALACAGALPVVRSLVVPDLNWCYPYMSADSYDWINAGLALAGERVASSWRPPGLPLLVAALFRLGLLSWLPAVNFMVVGLTTAALYTFLRQRHGAWIAALASWFFFANDYVQDLAKYILGEVTCTLFILLAAHAFARAARDPRFYRRCGLYLGLGFLFHHAAAFAGIGFAAAFVVTRFADVRRSEVWQGVAAGGLLAGVWAGARWVHFLGYSGGPRHIQEELVRVSLDNVRFYAFALPALLGLVLLPLYGLGALRFVAKDYPDRAYRAAVAAPLLAVGVFFLFFYDWVDKRFLYYLFPFCICLLAEGLDALAAYARRGRLAACVAGGFLLLALVWNQIRYPSYGFQYLALTPVHFLEARMVPSPTAKADLHIEGARVVRVHERLLTSFAHGLFDPRRVSVACDTENPSYSCLAVLKREADRLLTPGQPIGLIAPRGWPADRWARAQRLANELLRPVSFLNDAEIAFAGVESLPAGADAARAPVLAACGPYMLVRTR
jgi:hypothetical protein